MPAISEDALSSSSEEQDNDDQFSPGGGGGGRRTKQDSTSPTLIDRVVLKKREMFQPSPYAQCYGDDEEDEEWAHLLPRDHRDDSTTSVGPVSAFKYNVSTEALPLPLLYSPCKCRGWSFCILMPSHIKYTSLCRSYNIIHVHALKCLSTLLFFCLQKRSLLSSIRRHIGR